MDEQDQHDHDETPYLGPSILGLHPRLQEREIAQALVAHRATVVEHADDWRIVCYRTWYILQTHQARCWRSQRALYRGFPRRPDGLPVSGIVLYATATAAKQAVKTEQHYQHSCYELQRPC